MWSDVKIYVKNFWSAWAVLLIPIFSIFVLYLDQDPENVRAMRCLYIIVIMAGYWMFQLLPLPVTSLIPIVAFPLAEISGTGQVCSKYFNGTMFMFIGGLIMSIGLEQVGLQKRVALFLLKYRCIRSSPSVIMASFMLITGGLSMLISNTATVASMIPLMNAYCQARYPFEMNHQKRNILLLSVAYAANIGGTGLITGNYWIFLIGQVRCMNFDSIQVKCQL